MNKTPPKPMPKHELKKDIARYEKKYTDKNNTLTQFLTETAANAWDLADMDAADLINLHAKIKKRGARKSLILLELKK